MRRVEVGTTTFHVADFGQALVKRLKDPQLSPLIRLPSSAGLARLSFGRIGRWYVICSQEAFFRRCIAADADAAKRLTHTSTYRAFTFESRPGLIASALTRAHELSNLVGNSAEYYRRAHTETPAAAGTDRKPADLEAPLRWSADALRSRHAFYFQLWHDADGVLRGKLRIVADESTNAASLEHNPAPPVVHIHGGL